MAIMMARKVGVTWITIWMNLWTKFSENIIWKTVTQAMERLMMILEIHMLTDLMTTIVWLLSMEHNSV